MPKDIIAVTGTALPLALVAGMLVHFSGGAYGVPIIHLGPAAFGGRLEESEEVFLTYGGRMATKTVEVLR